MNKIKKLKKIIATGLIFSILITGCASDFDSDNTTERATDNTTERATDNTTERATDNTTEYATDNVTESGISSTLNTLNLAEISTKDEKNMNIIIKIGTNSFAATLSDNMTADAFKKILPLNITMEDVNGNEKYYLLPTNIRQEDPQNPVQINAGDIMCYGDKGLVLFYESFPTSYNYVKIGKIDNASGLMEALKGSKINVTISAAE